jgi:hypothetical protein
MDRVRGSRPGLLPLHRSLCPAPHKSSLWIRWQPVASAGVEESEEEEVVPPGE